MQLFSERLKGETSSAHQGLEKVIVGQIRAIHSLEEYKKLLSVFYSYYYPLELQLDALLNNAVVPQYQQRRKAVSIAEDMEGLPGPGIDALEQPVIPVLNTTAEALGAYYVLEGSTLGGVHIAAMLRKKASIPAEHLHFFEGYGAGSTILWTSFTNALNDYAVQHPGEDDAMIDAARRVFAGFELYARKCYGMEEILVSPSKSPS